jgi:hypothetical protein
MAGGPASIQPILAAYPGHWRINNHIFRAIAFVYLTRLF